MSSTSKITRGMKRPRGGLLAYLCRVLPKPVTGLIGNSYALVADAIESSTDVFSSLIVWRGLRIAEKPPDDTYPYGYGRAASISAAVVSLMLIGSAISIVALAIREILTPHYTPAPFTLIVLGGVIVCKELL